MKSKAVPQAAPWPAVLFVLAYAVARAGLKLAGPSPGPRVALALLPVPFFAWFLLRFVAGIRTLDELQRRIQLEALAVAFPLTLLLLMTLGLLELAVGLDPGNWSCRHAWAFLPLFYFLGVVLAARRYR